MWQHYGSSDTKCHLTQILIFFYLALSLRDPMTKQFTLVIRVLCSCVQYLL